MLTIGRAIEAIETPAAKAREKAGKAPFGNFPEGHKGDTRDKVGAAVGVSGKHTKPFRSRPTRVYEPVEAEDEEEVSASAGAVLVRRTGRFYGRD